MRANNFISLIGRLGADPETKTLGENKKFSTFSLAVTRSKTETDWFRCTAWNSLSDLVEKYLKKGDRVSIVGSMRVEKKDDKTYYTVVLEGLEFLSGNKESTNETPNEQLELAGMVGGALPPF
jgi:single-strand DNA-binding protein